MKCLLEHSSIFPYNERNHVFLRHMTKAEIHLEYHLSCMSSFSWNPCMCISQRHCLIQRCLCHTWYWIVWRPSPKCFQSVVQQDNFLSFLLWLSGPFIFHSCCYWSHITNIQTLRYLAILTFIVHRSPWSHIALLFQCTKVQESNIWRVPWSHFTPATCPGHQERVVKRSIDISSFLGCKNSSIPLSPFLSLLNTKHNLLNGFGFPRHRKTSYFRDVCFGLTIWTSTENENTDGAGSWGIQGKKTVFNITGHLFAIASLLYTYSILLSRRTTVTSGWYNSL